MEKNKNVFYNYVYLDPRKPGNHNYGNLYFDYEPFYIGYGQNGRINDHLNEVIKYKDNKKYKIGNKHKFYKIKKILDQGLEPIRVKLFENLDLEKIKENEIKLIKMIGRKDLKLGPLTNLTDGGDGSSGWKPTEKNRKNISKGVKKRYEDPEEREKTGRAGKKRYEDPKEREKTSIIQKKRYEDPKEREKTGKSMIGKNKNKKSKEHKEKLSEKAKLRIGKKSTNKKKLYQYNNELNLIKIWFYAKECSLNNNNLKYVSIIRYVKYNTKNPNNLKSYKGYIFSYIELNKNKK